MLPLRSNDNANGRRQVPPAAINGVNTERPFPSDPMVGSAGMGESPNEGSYALPQRGATAGEAMPSPRLTVGTNGQRQVLREEANGDDPPL